MKNNCTIPNWFGYKEWVGLNIGDLCTLHDDMWVTRNFFLFVYSNLYVTFQIFKRGHILTGIASIPYFWVLGFPFWTYKSVADAIKFFQNYK